MENIAWTLSVKCLKNFFAGKETIIFRKGVKGKKALPSTKSNRSLCPCQKKKSKESTDHNNFSKKNSNFSTWSPSTKSSTTPTL